MSDYMKGLPGTRFAREVVLRERNAALEAELAETKSHLEASRELRQVNVIDELEADRARLRAELAEANNSRANEQK